MKSAETLSKVFAFAAAGLILIAAIGCGLYWNTPLMILPSMERAEKQTERFMEAVSQGNYAAAEDVLYGHPKLEWDPDQASELGSVLWDAFGDSISYEFSGGCYVSSAGIFRDVTVTGLDLPAMIPIIQEQFQQLLPKRVMGHRNRSEIYDESGNYRESFVMDVLVEAAEQVLRENSSVSEWNVTLELVCQDGQWQIVPNQQMIYILCGGLT